MRSLGSEWSTRSLSIGEVVASNPSQGIHSESSSSNFLLSSFPALLWHLSRSLLNNVNSKKGFSHFRTFVFTPSRAVDVFSSATKISVLFEC